MKTGVPDLVERRLSKAKRLWLFLDYDGTLADFAPTPAHVNPDAELIELLAGLAQHPRIRSAVVSGRRLAHIAELVPVPGVFLAGTYGIELQLPQGEQIHRVSHTAVRPALDVLKTHWERLIGHIEGFFLEDKGWALALHARFASKDDAAKVLAAARRTASEVASGRPFRVLGGDRFLEVGPQIAHKGKTVAYLLEHYAWPGALPLYLGDDDKDEEAFGVVKARDGVAIVVAPEPCDTQADCRLESPQAAREWLAALPTYFDSR